MKFRFDEPADINNLAFCLYMEHEESKDRESKAENKRFLGTGLADRQDDDDEE